MTWKPDICIYHANCPDGFASAWLVRRKWGNSVRMVPGSYGQPLPDDVAGKHVLFVDFSARRDEMIRFANGNNIGAVPSSIVILDHHKTAEAELAEWNVGPVSPAGIALVEIDDLIRSGIAKTGHPIVAHFDMKHSGAMMTLEFCFGSEDLGAARTFFELVEDRDLWRMKHGPTTEMFTVALRSYPQDFGVWDLIVDKTWSLIEEGRHILRSHKQNIANMLKQVHWRGIGLYYVPTLNVPYHYASDAAHELLQQYPHAPFAASWFSRGDGRVQFSLRSEAHRVDVSDVAKAFGGGGHRNAAGFDLAADDWAGGFAIDKAAALATARTIWPGIAKIDGCGYSAEHQTIWLRADQARDATGRCINVHHVPLDAYVSLLERTHGPMEDAA